MGRGSVRERAPGRWQIRAYVADNRWTSETVRGTRTDAERRLRKLLDEIDDGAHRGPDRTVAQLLDQWLEARGLALSPSTLAMTKGHIENYLRPKLGRVRLSRLEPSKIDTFYGELRRAGVKGEPLSPSYIRRIHGTLHLALEQAVAWGWLARNPAGRASPPPARREALDVPDVGQVLRLLDAAANGFDYVDHSGDLPVPREIAPNPPLATFLRMAAAAGPRRGEISGLRRSDIDFDAGAVTFRRVIIHAGPGDVVIKPYPKSRVARRIALDAETIEAVIGHLTWLEKRAMSCGTDLDPDPWVFSHDLRADTPPRPDAYTRAFVRLRDRLGLHVRLHDLRHAHATAMLTAGVDVRTVAGRLGHASATTTLSIYAGWVPAADRAAADLAGGLLKRPRADAGEEP
jgi:integrase